MSNNEFKLPPHTYESVITTLSQSNGWGIKQTKIPNTWKVTQGEGMRCLVIDTGHPIHPDIGDNAIEGKNFVPGESINDSEGHQTHCTGIICAKNNDEGMVGVAPMAKCITAKALGEGGSGSFEWVNNALKYALKTKPDVVSMSLGAPNAPAYLHETIRALYEANIPVVAAAGNSGKRVDYPGAYAETITVAAYDKKGSIANFSGIGEKVDWAAPGVAIYSTYLNNEYAVLNGTSMATPFIAGVILLLLAKHKKQEIETGKNDCKTIDQIKEHLKKYTIDKGLVGKDKYFGYGILDVEGLIIEKSSTGENIALLPKKLTTWDKFKNFLWKFFEKPL